MDSLARWQAADLPDYHDDALVWVNAWRARMNRPTLAEGVCRDPSRCSLTESLGTGWVGGGGRDLEPGIYWHSGDDYFGSVRLPNPVLNFVVDFDSGRYPELIA
jgi:hypothetical protein